jgi:hypothetical protein
MLNNNVPFFNKNVSSERELVRRTLSNLHIISSFGAIFHDPLYTETIQNS